MGAPIMTVIPGKPLYLPGAKNKRNTAHALVSASSGNFAELAALGKDIDIEELRWFDFQQTYNVYGRKGKPCRKCKSIIENKKIGQRSSFFCFKCQS